MKTPLMSDAVWAAVEPLLAMEPPELTARRASGIRQWATLVGIRFVRHGGIPGT
jgi:hypothetical protein